jgi:phosphoglycolate phosphatase
MTSHTLRYRAVIFDLDGTLIDSAPDIAAAINLILERRGATAQSVEHVASFTGFGARRLVHDLFAAVRLPVDDATIDAALEEYLDNYAQAPAERTLFYPHVREDLQALHDAGIRLGICTNKPHALTLKILGILGIVHLFEAVVGADAAPAIKPDPSHLLTVAERIGLNGEAWAYVGDTPVDQATAAAAAVPFFAVPWGSGSRLQVAPERRLRRLLDLAASSSLQARAET